VIPIPYLKFVGFVSSGRSGSIRSVQLFVISSYLNRADKNRSR